MNYKQSEKLPFFGIPKLLPVAAAYKKKILIMICLGFVSSFIDSLYPIANKFALDNFIATGDLGLLPAFIGIYLALLIFQAVDNLISTSLCGEVEVSVNRDLRNNAFSHLQELSFSYFNTNNVGYIHARVMSDTSKMGETVAWRLMDIVWHGAYIICVFGVMLTVDVGLSLIFAIFLPIAAVFIMLFQGILTKMNRRIREINSRITSNYNEGIMGAKTIKALNIADRINNRFRVQTDDMYRTSVKTTHVSALFTSTVTFIGSLILAVVLWKGGIMSREGLIGLGTLTVFISYALGILDPIQYIISTISELITIQVNIKRYFDLIEEEPNVTDSPEVIEKYGTSFEPKRENWEELKGEIEFRDVSFKYPDGDEYVLNDFNLMVPQGSRIAIVGETGAGKSTLVNLVCRFFEPTKGEVLIDGIPADKRSQLWLHSNIGYVLQTPHLFSGSIRENLLYAAPDATDDELWAALEMVSAADFVRNMEKGLDSEAGESGDMLSTGEKQLISFARALLADPKILVLDEATSSIDTVTEKLIQEATKVVTDHRTSFVIAHRLSTVIDADVIIAVCDGRIVEQGTHDELMKAHGYYYDLYTMQVSREIL